MTRLQVLLLGSVIGFVGSAIGSFIVDTMQVKRRARLKMLQESVPGLKAPGKPSRKDKLEAMHRQTVLLSRKEERLVSRLIRLHEQQVTIFEALADSPFDSDTGQHAGEAKYQEERKPVEAEHEQTVQALDSELRRRLRFTVPMRL